MAKRRDRKNRHRKGSGRPTAGGGRTTPKGTRPPGSEPSGGRRHRPPHAAEPPPLLDDVERALEERSPFDLFTFASSLVEVATPRPTDFITGREDRIDPNELFMSFADTDWPAMSALALAAVTLHPDQLLAQRVRRMVDIDTFAELPGWVRTMGTIVVDQVRLHSDPLGDGENVVISCSWPEGGDLTIVAFVDHNMGSALKDLIVIPESMSAVEATFVEYADGTISVSDLDPADARARLTEAIAHTERLAPPIETDTWPVGRPLLEWVLRHLPDGGTGYVRPEWDEAARDELLDAFVASPFAAVDGLDAQQVRTLADPLVWYACDWGPGDPLRWSPVAVELVLSDWYPRKVFGLPDDEMLRVPDVLAAFVRYCHDRQGVDEDLTAETLDAVEEFRVDFELAASDADRSPERNAARLARIAAGLDPDSDDEWGDDADDEWDPVLDGVGVDDDAFMARVTDELEAEVVAVAGGRAAYDRLDAEPLGDAPFDWTRVPAALREPTGETLELLDRWSVELFDAEVRTIARAVLAGVVDADRAVFKRSARADALAAGILGCLLDRLTGRMPAREREQLGWRATTKKAIAEHTGVSASSVGSRSKTISNVVERADIDWPANLHSSQRREMLMSKTLITEWRANRLGSAPDHD